MTESHLPEENAINDRSLNKLVRAITLSDGNFSLILARCNYGSLRDRVVQQVKRDCPIDIHELQLQPQTKTLYTTIQAEFAEIQPRALMIFGLERVEQIAQLLISTNQVREEFRKNFAFPIVLWVNDDVLTNIIQLMPDFKSWTGNSIKFEIEREELAQSVGQPVAEAFAAILNVGEGKFLSLAKLYPQKPDLSLELAAALRDLRSDGDDRLQASLQFLVAREADLKGEKREAKVGYEESLVSWKAVTAGSKDAEDWARYGCALLHLGLWWRQYATQHRAEYESACLQAKDYYQQGLAAFDRTDRPELSAKFINVLGEVLTRLGKWDELARVAHLSVELHRSHPEPIRLAFAYGLLAEVALQGKDWTTVQQRSELALEITDRPSLSSIDWGNDSAQRRNLYLLLLAQAQSHLNQVPEAIRNLEAARDNFESQYDPTIFIRILETLRSLYFDQGEYLQAFEMKQEQRSVEQQYGLRAFVGAGRLQARRQVMNPGLATIDAKAAVTQEIAASGRMVDVDRLLERLGRNDHKLTVVYGQSGVGKSSLVQAGLVPALRQRAIDARDVLPVLLQVYTNWEKNLGDRLVESLEEVQGLSLPLFLDSMAAFIAEIQKSDDKNLLTVLIFDQFEEFFFAYKDPTLRRPFFEFLRDCLNVPYVKVILSLREDYLHYLLECNRLTHLDVIDNNILDKKILYYLGNFSPEDGRAVIQNLTDACQFSLEPALMDELVRDLAGELNEVRPIELQVVGAQMQTERVTTLTQYMKEGPKEKFVGRFLEEVVTDCGTNNQQFAKIILYLLTDDNLTRPLKTRGELEADLSIESKRLDLILNILVKSGLVFQVPGFPADRYQLVHDYLVPFVRQQQAAGLVAELEKEREQRKLTEEKLNKALTQQLKTARRSMWTFAGLSVAIGAFGITATVVASNIYFASLLTESLGSNELDKLISSIKAGKKMKELPIAVSEIRLLLTSEINQVINNSREINRLEVDTDQVSQIIFSPNGKLIASLSEENVAKVWNVGDGKLLTTTEESKKVSAISFSSDSRMLIYASNDRKINFWTISGDKPKEFSIEGKISSISVSLNNRLIAISVGKDIILWDLSEGKIVRTFKGGTGIITSMGFSPDGKVLTSAGQDDGVNIWSLETGKTIKSINDYGAINTRFTSDGKILILTKNNESNYYTLDGILVKRTQADFGQSTAINSDGKLTARNSSNGSVDITNVNTANLKSSYYYKNFDSQNSYLRFSPDGKILASATGDRKISLWRTDNITERNNKSRSVKFSPDGQMIASGHSNSAVDLLNKQGILQKTIKGDATIFGFSPDGKEVLTKSSDHTVKLRNADGKETTYPEDSNQISKISTSPDRKIAILFDRNGKLSFMRNNKFTKTNIKCLEKEFLGFSSDSKFFLINKTNFVHIWQSNGKYIGKLPGHTSKIKTAFLSPDSELIVTIGDNNFVNLYNKNGKLINVLRGHSDEVLSVEFSPDSQILLSMSESQENGRKSLNLWSRDGVLIKSLRGDFTDSIGLLRSRRISYFNRGKNNKIIKTIDGGNNTIEFWDFSGNKVGFIQLPEKVTGLSVSSDNEMIASVNEYRTVQLWRLDGTLLKVLKGISGPVDEVMFNPVDSQTFISKSRNGMIQLWNRSGTKLKVLQPAMSDNDKVASTDFYFSEDGKYITIINVHFSFSNDNKEGERGAAEYTIQTWSTDGVKISGRKELARKTNIQETDIGSPQKPQEIRNDDLSMIQRRIGFDSGNVNNIAWIEQDRSFKTWNLDGSLRATFSGHQDNVNSISFSPDGKIIASGGDDKTVRLWNRDGRLLKKLSHADRVNSVEFSADSKLFASGSDDRTIKLWTHDGQLIKTLGHVDKVNMVKFNHIDNTLASISGEKTVTLWTQTGELKSTRQHFEKVINIAFTFDGKTLVSNYQNDEMAKLWRASDGKEIIGSAQNYSVYESPGNIKPSIPYGFQFDGVLPAFKSYWRSLKISPDQTTFATVGDKVSVVDFDMDRLLIKACGLARNYLKNNSKVKEDDRKLCDDIPIQK